MALASLHRGWRPARRWSAAELPAPWRRLLADRSSLTARLRRQAGGRLAVDLIRQAVVPPHPLEARFLGLPPRRAALVREVFLGVPGQRWVYARSVIPLAVLVGHRRALRRLGERPLGTVLFADPDLERGEPEIARLPATAVPGLAGQAGWLWGRRSRFRAGASNLLVVEVFLPDYRP
ncbi:MAG: putative chorismate pyruvate-lyase [Porticoccaceae bacterium]|nr:MAG: putative chorismate pyruvate-lyase [Porticoccaceae bacterium]